MRVQGEVYGVSFYGGRSARAGIAALSKVLVRCVFGGPQTSEADMRGSVDTEQEATRCGEKSEETDRRPGKRTRAVGTKRES